MTASTPVLVYGAVEGPIDEAVLTRLIQHVSARPGAVYGKRGKPYVKQHLGGYNNAARFSRWIVLVDLNDEEQCAPALCRKWLPAPALLMCFRVAVRKVEAWLLADRERMAQYLHVDERLIPRDAESIPDPKRSMVELARRSRRRAIAQDMVPRPASGRAVGPAYTSRLVEFASSTAAGWRPEVAAAASDSLRRCLAGLRELAGG